jgi:aspartate-semialdehyde dehydrogenase
VSHLSQHKIAVVGATGIVGQEFLKILYNYGVPAGHVFAIASPKSAGQVIQYGNSTLIVQALDTFDFSKCNIGLFSPGAIVSSIFVPKATEQGCWVIDNTSFFRMDPDVPLVVPEVNSQAMNCVSKHIIANPNCSTIQMVMALKPIDDVCALRTVIVATYQSVSGAGTHGVSELCEQVFGGTQIDRFPRRIAENVIPQIDVFLDGGHTKEEQKMVEETHKILRSDITVLATCVRVPVVRGHCETVAIELSDDVPVTTLERALSSFSGVTFLKDGYVCPQDVDGQDNVYVCRLRKCGARWYQMWVVADNIRKGAALNAVQIADLVASRWIHT